MASKKIVRAARSKSCGSQPRQGLRSAASYADVTLSDPKMHCEEKLSPCRDESLPSTNPNQNKGAESARGPPPNTSSEGRLNSEHSFQKEETLSLESGLTTERSSHKELSNKTAPQLGSSVNKSTEPSTPEEATPTADDVSKSGTQTPASHSTGTQISSSPLVNPSHTVGDKGSSPSPSHSQVQSGIRVPELINQQFEDRGTDTPDFPSQFPPLPPGESWLKFFEDMRSIGKRLSSLEKIEKIEKTTDSFSEQLTAVMQRSDEIEEAVKTNASKVADVNEQIVSLKILVEKQSKDIDKLKNLESVVGQHSKDLKGLKTLKDSLTKATGRVVDEMRDLVTEQRKQMDSFQSASKQIKSNTAQLVEEKVQQARDECDFKSLKSEAFSKRFNLFILGLKETPEENTRNIVKDFISNNMKIKDVNVNSAHRLGSAQEGDSDHIRPIVISFANLAHRNKIWRQRREVTNEEDNVVKVQADLPKKLRKDTQLLYKVLKAASAIPEFQTARVRDYMLELNGRKYAPSNLESLPKPIRPSTIAMRESEETLVFYTSHSFLSNHHQSSFNIQGQIFANIEQYLAFKKAQLSGQGSIIQRASNATNPLEAKYILHTLKKDHTQEWDKNVSSILAEGLRAKFTQNKNLLDRLRATKNKTLGEASKNPRWGIGMTLEDGDVLDQDKWNKSGNLLGRTLMKVRSEVLNKEKSKHKNNK